MSLFKKKKKELKNENDDIPEELKKGPDWCIQNDLKAHSCKHCNREMAAEYGTKYRRCAARNYAPTQAYDVVNKKWVRIRWDECSAFDPYHHCDSCCWSRTETVKIADTEVEKLCCKHPKTVELEVYDGPCVVESYCSCTKWSNRLAIENAEAAERRRKYEESKQPTHGYMIK